MRELPEPEGFSVDTMFTESRSTANNYSKGAMCPVSEWWDRDQVLAIQKQAYEDGLREAGKDAELIEWLAKNLDWDGHGYWLPEICIKERQLGEDFVPEPSANELRAMLTASQKEQK